MCYVQTTYLSYVQPEIAVYTKRKKNKNGNKRLLQILGGEFQSGDWVSRGHSSYPWSPKCDSSRMWHCSGIVELGSLGPSWQCVGPPELPLAVLRGSSGARIEPRSLIQGRVCSFFQASRFNILNEKVEQ